MPPDDEPGEPFEHGGHPATGSRGGQGVVSALAGALLLAPAMAAGDIDPGLLVLAGAAILVVLDLVLLAAADLRFRRARLVRPGR